MSFRLATLYLRHLIGDWGDIDRYVVAKQRPWLWTRVDGLFPTTLIDRFRPFLIVTEANREGDNDSAAWTSSRSASISKTINSFPGIGE